MVEVEIDGREVYYIEAHSPEHAVALLEDGDCKPTVSECTGYNIASVIESSAGDCG
jgi:hypothetical protein